MILLLFFLLLTWLVVATTKVLVVNKGSIRGVWFYGLGYSLGAYKTGGYFEVVLYRESVNGRWAVVTGPNFKQPAIAPE